MSTHIDLSPEATAAALLMMARTASYVPREFSLPSFSFGFTDSRQEETQTQEGEGQPEPQVKKNPKTTVLIEELDELSGEKTALDFAGGKSPPIEKQTVSQIFDKFETPTKSNLMDESTDEYDPVCTLNAQQSLVLSIVHFASLKVISYIEADIITAMCLILNQENIKRFQEEIYCLPLNIVVRCNNMAIENHAGGEFLQPKSKKPFMVEDYPMFIPFLDLKKLASHSYGYVISRIRL
ncbi:hypothetical protein Ahy_B03g067205 [Arachis hypogaea]|uniref:Uncharacterized protein n=1 Tax=Arachis hypogaea TaxID=3818 RepID=A0A445A640_ARAHY|nr:hypothetical protein Ahy_B03g067205 [Arachis hypogaea]